MFNFYCHQTCSFLTTSWAVNSILKEKDERLKEKDERLRAMEKEKDERLRAMEKEKDERLKEKAERLQEKDDRLKAMEKEKDDRLKAMEKEKDERLKEKDERLREKDNQLREKVAELLMARAKLGAVAGNRPIVEIGLTKMYPAEGSLTSRWHKFAEENVFEPGRPGKLRTAVAKLLSELDCETQQSAVEKELKDFIHELSKPMHHLERTPGNGVVIGGPEPLGCAVALVVLLLQRFDAFDFPVRFVDENYADKKLLRGGQVREPIT